MKERILAFLKAENKSSSQFAEEIGVQPSGISHILSGRNKPSLDFVLKMLERYPFISTEWLLFGKGSMYSEPSLATLFDEPEGTAPEKTQDNTSKVPEKADQNAKRYSEPVDSVSKITSEKNKSRISKIIWFYDDNSFEEFFPHIV